MIRRWAVGFLAAGVLLGLAGCQSSAKKPLDYTPMVARFFLESGSGDGMPLTLPQSDVRVTVNTKPVITEGDRTSEDISDDVMIVPEADEIVAPMLSVVPLQLLAYYIGVAKGCDVDKPRNLAKSVTVE